MDQQFDAIVRELERLNQTLDSLKPPSSPPPVRSTDPPSRIYLSGRWHRRDGDGYGIFPRPGVHHGVTYSNDQTGNL
jgi:hypothetical protein